MIRYGQTLVGLLLFLFACAGQSAQYSAYSLRLMHEIDQAPKAQGQPLLSEGLKKKFGIRDTQSGPVVHAFIRTGPEFDLKQVEKLGVTHQSKVGELHTVIIPVRYLKKLGRVKGIKQIEISTPVSLR